jgi:hypothetical protein
MILLLMLALLRPPAVGQILIATEKSHDPDLAKSVVLVIHSDSDGVMGLILNRPRAKSTYHGGPIPLGSRALSRNKAEQILPGVYMSAGTKDPTARIYEGYPDGRPGN